MSEGFRPISNTAPVGFFGKLKFYSRFIFDYQTKTVYRNVKQFTKNLNGKVLDIGCGDSPYRHLLNPSCEYIGLDIKNQDDFGYRNREILYFDGYHIPLKDNSVDAIICTEVIEHVVLPEKLIADIKRVMKPKASGIITVPWSARNHYIPFDYHRYTYYMLKLIFKDFTSVQILVRGSDITVICSKIIIAYFRTFFPNKMRKLLFLPFAILLAPILIVAVTIGHLSVLFDFGSDDDPLGYTVFFKN